MNRPRVKIGTEFYQSGYGRGVKKASVYLIDGFAYARSRYAWNTDFQPLKGELEGYVRVNAIKSGDSIVFAQCNEQGYPNRPHLPVPERIFAI